MDNPPPSTTAQCLCNQGYVKNGTACSDMDGCPNTTCGGQFDWLAQAQLMTSDSERAMHRQRGAVDERHMCVQHGIHGRSCHWLHWLALWHGHEPIKLIDLQTMALVAM
jgi:hypothetical protein